MAQVLFDKEQFLNDVMIAISDIEDAEQRAISTEDSSYNLGESSGGYDPCREISGGPTKPRSKRGRGRRQVPTRRFPFATDRKRPRHILKTGDDPRLIKLESKGRKILRTRKLQEMLCPYLRKFAGDAASIATGVASALAAIAATGVAPFPRDPTLVAVLTILTVRLGEGVICKDFPNAA